MNLQDKMVEEHKFVLQNYWMELFNLKTLLSNILKETLWYYKTFLIELKKILKQHLSGPLEVVSQQSLKSCKDFILYNQDRLKLMEKTFKISICIHTENKLVTLVKNQHYFWVRSNKILNMTINIKIQRLRDMLKSLMLRSLLINGKKVIIIFN